MNDKQDQKPFSNSQIESTRPNAPKTRNLLTGYIANSMNGGHNRTLAWKKVMAGEKHYQYNMKLNIKMLTPITPTYQNLKMTIRAFFVPNSRVWEEAEKFISQKGGSSEVKVKKYPTMATRSMPSIDDAIDNDFTTNVTNSEDWRNHFASCYIPRVGQFRRSQGNESYTMPEYNILPLRGMIAIYNDFLRNKEYDEPIQEYKSTTVSQTEWNSYMPSDGLLNYDIQTMRAKRDNSYYTDYRTEIQGFEDAYTNGQSSADSALITWASWEAKIAEARNQAENAQLNDWDVLAKLRGSKKLTEGKVQLIGQQTFNLNYAAITQNTYNNNETIQEKYRVLGQQGAYSYTEVNVPIYAGMQFNEEGFVHIIACVSADSVYEKAFERTLMNTSWEEEYRPDLEGQKFDILYKGELNSEIQASMTREAIGFKRKWSELFKLPNIVAGDMTNENYFQSLRENSLAVNVFEKEKQIETNKTFQFFETSPFIDYTETGTTLVKKLWKDYTDIMINKNQAIMNEYEEWIDVPTGQGEINIKGNHQIFLVGICSCAAELPVNSEIADNYTKWGEH